MVNVAKVNDFDVWHLSPVSRKAVPGVLREESVHVTLYIWLGTCDLTVKEGKFISLRSTDFQVVTDLCQTYQDILKYMRKFPTVRLIFLQIPLYSVYWWNAFHNHPEPDQFVKQDEILHDQLYEVNKYLVTLNNYLHEGINSPDFNSDILASRKGHYDRKTRYSTSFALYLDGIHPSPVLAKLWLIRLCLRFANDCN